MTARWPDAQGPVGAVYPLSDGVLLSLTTAGTAVSPVGCAKSPGEASQPGTESGRFCARGQAASSHDSVGKIAAALTRAERPGIAILPTLRPAGGAVQKSANSGRARRDARSAAYGNVVVTLTANGSHQCPCRLSEL
jgi:hypothetical protein